jgi:hypothetical protein
MNPLGFCIYCLVAGVMPLAGMNFRGVEFEIDQVE